MNSTTTRPIQKTIPRQLLDRLSVLIRKNTTRSRLFSWLFPFLSGVVFLSVFLVGYSLVPGELYEFRDDGLITLSHAKNLADFGFIGVNPSGGKVEGFSSPLEFAVYFLLYSVFDMPYDCYATMQTWVCIFAIGFLFHLFFKQRPLLVLASSVPAAIFLFSSYGFSLWHGSGMENALTHTFHLLSLYLLFRMIETQKIRLWTALILFLASISRIEAIWHIGPVVFVFAVAWLISYRNWRGFGLLSIFISIWVVFNMSRYAYFGTLLPNTSGANGIDVLANMKSIVTIDPKYLNSAISRSFTVLRGLNFWCILVLFPFLYIAKRQKNYSHLFLMLGVLMTMAALHPVVFGKVRLDIVRPVSQLSMYVALASVAVLYLMETKFSVTICTLVLLLTVGAVLIAPGTKPRKLCCSAENFQYRVDILKQIGDSQSLFRPTVALPDLGIVSYHKLFNVVDLGRLGSPLVAKMRYDPQSMTRYLLEYAAPDFLEIHGAWRKKYRTFLKSGKFKKRYEKATRVIQTTRVSKERLSEFWVRKDIKANSESKERRLIDQLSNSLDVAIIENEINNCSSNEGHYSCLYVTRTVYRFFPEILEAGYLPRLKEAFKKTKTTQYDEALLDCRHDGQWYQKAHADIISEFR